MPIQGDVCLTFPFLSLAACTIASPTSLLRTNRTSLSLDSLCCSLGSVVPMPPYPAQHLFLFVVFITRGSELALDSTLYKARSALPISFGPRAGGTVCLVLPFSISDLAPCILMMSLFLSLFLSVEM